MTQELRVITIDGPAGSGKSTTARGVAEKLGWRYIDTGAMYRALGLAVLNSGGLPDEEDDVLPVLDEVQIDLLTGIPPKILLNGEDVSSKIRTPETSDAASKVSVHDFVRDHLVKMQRALGIDSPSVLEGRDTGTVIFPDAGLKIFLQAELKARATRRLSDYHKQGLDKSLEDVLREMIERDQRDTQRSNSPLRIADGALVIDTTDISIEEQIDKVVQFALERFALEDVSR